MILRLLSCNLQGLHTKEELRTITKYITALKPMIIFFQEAKNTEQNNITDTLAALLTYDHILFFPTYFSLKDYGKGKLATDPYTEGLCVVSQVPLNTEVIHLPIRKGIDRWPRIAVRINFKDKTFLHTHLSKTAESRMLQIKALPDFDVLVGDLNMQPDELQSFHLGQSSYYFSPYISYPSKNITLDYIILKKGTFLSVKTFSIGSDHKALFAEINL